MNRSLGAGLLIVLSLGATRLISGSSSTPPPDRVVDEKVAARSLSGISTKVTHHGGCAAYSPPRMLLKKTYPEAPEEGSAYPIIDRFLGGTLSSSKSLPAGLNVAIALVPDPIHTELSVMTDRQLVAIEQAAQDEKYNYDSSWLPWTRDSRAFDNLADTQRVQDIADSRNACPGVLLFRWNGSQAGPQVHPTGVSTSFDRGLMVMVVGEQPTGGINQDQWDNAIEWLNRLNSGKVQKSSVKQNLRILGPTFSGSLDSLARNLTPAKLKGLTFDMTHVDVLSGGVSSRGSINSFRESMREARTSVRFGSFQENDSLQIERALDYWNKRGSARRSSVAILSEDETAYGDDAFSEPDPGKLREKPLMLAYPRDLSTLRAQYQKEAVFSSGSPEGAKQVRSILQDGAEPSDDTHTPSDTIPAYSGHVAPLTQEAVLYGIVGQLRIHHARFVLLRCTNPLDYLFLTRFLHRAYPDGRIVLVGQDMLLRREIDTTEFRGVMSLTNYPLIPKEAHWSSTASGSKPSGPHTHRIFESHIAEGTYLAARYIIAPAWLDEAAPNTAFSGTLVRKIDSPSYSDPFWFGDKADLTRPPTWLTVVGRDGFWPVAVLNTPRPTTLRAVNKQDQAGWQQDSMSPQSTLQIVTPECWGSVEHQGFELSLSWRVCAFLVIVFVSYQAWGLWPKNEFFSTGLFAIFRPATLPAHQIVLGLNCAFSSVLVLVVLGVLLPGDGLSALGTVQSLVAICWMLPIATLISLCIILINRLDHSWWAVVTTIAPAAIMYFFWYGYIFFDAEMPSPDGITVLPSLHLRHLRRLPVAPPPLLH